MLRRIISGGQTGADRAALDACLAVGFPCGGCCPAGRRAEDGPIDARYPLDELAGAGCDERTRRNVEAADGTLIFHDAEVGGGTELTLCHCIATGRPYRLIDIALVPVEPATGAARAFVARHDIAVLNVAGPRASTCPRMYGFVRACIEGVLADTRPEPGPG